MTAATRLDPQLRTIRQLFGDPDTVYTVPVYQRNYAWEAEQIEQLISDVQDAMDGSEDGYFLGNLIVTRRAPMTADFEVIDGQQRLTTLYLLLTLLAEDGAAPYRAHQDRLRYESRGRATEALRRIAAESPLHALAWTPEASGREDGRIHQGFNVIQQYMDQHVSGRSRLRFADFLRDKVTVVRVTLPLETDVNRYFEIMNTRGQQLQPVDIVKTRLMSRLDNEVERGCFAWIWDACADMDSYVQMSLTPGNPSRRDQIFLEDWSWLDVRGFPELLRIYSSAGDGSAANAATGTPMTLDGALAKYAAIGPPDESEDPDNVRFRSTIEFPVFLLHVLKVMDGDDEEQESHLDDKRLIERFQDAFAGKGSQWVRDFAFELLKCRNLFDNCILKRQYTATNGDDGDWSLQRLVKRLSKGKRAAGYANTFSRDIAEEEDSTADQETRDLLLLQSRLSQSSVSR